MKLKIGVIFGGKSLEHEMSIITALQAMEHIDQDKYEIVPIYITKDLVWYSSGCLKYIDSFKMNVLRGMNVIEAFEILKQEVNVKIFDAFSS
mgnify:CR=1 FL=1